MNSQKFGCVSSRLKRRKSMNIMQLLKCKMVEIAVRENSNSLRLMNSKWPNSEKDEKEKKQVDEAFKKFKSINDTINRTVMKNYTITENSFGMPEFDCTITLPVIENQKTSFSDEAQEYFKRLVSEKLKADDPGLFKKIKVTCSCFCVKEPDPRSVSEIYKQSADEGMYVEHYYIRIILIE